MSSPSPELIDAVVKAYAEVARPLILRWFPEPNSCIAASRATIEVLDCFGIRAWPLSVRMKVEVKEAHVGFGMGLLPEEQSRAERNPNHSRFSTRSKGWPGHLIVGTENNWLIDPTFDTVFRGFRKLGYDSGYSNMILAVPAGKEVDPLGFAMTGEYVLNDGNTLEVTYLSSPNEDYRKAPAWETDHLQILIGQIIQGIVELVRPVTRSA